MSADETRGNGVNDDREKKMPPIKILHLIPTLSSGGAERQLVNLVTKTERERVDHTVCVINDSTFFASSIRSAGYKVIDFNLSNKHPFIKTRAAFRRVIADEKPDVIHTWLYDANVSARLAAFHSSIPIVTSLQLADYEPDAIHHANWNSRKVRVLRSIDKISAWMTDPYFVACSNFVANSYKKNFGVAGDKIKVIYNSVDPQVLDSGQSDEANLRDELALPADGFVYLNVGRLDPQKNHKTIFAAFRQILDKAPNAFLLLAGVGSMESELRDATRNLGIDEKVRFLGRRGDVGALLALADVFIFPSLFEGLPVALVEAMFKRLPCIASQIEVFAEVIEDNKTGLLIDPLSPDELASAMMRLYEDADLRRTLGDNAYEHAATKFSSSATAREWEELYAEIYRDARTAL